jgi:hypothetical protein
MGKLAKAQTLPHHQNGVVRHSKTSWKGIDGKIRSVLK